MSRLLVLLLAAAAHAELALDSFQTNAITNSPSKRGTVASLEFQLPGFGGAAEVTGTLALSGAKYFAFDCDFTGGQLVFVWVGDHLVCHTNPPFGNTPSSTDGSAENPLMGGASLPVVIHIYAKSDKPGSVSSNATAGVSVKWSLLSSPMAAGSKPPTASVPASALSPKSSPLELQRRQLQKGLASGWNTWSYNMLEVVRLPHSFGLNAALCKLSSGKCLETTKVEDTAASVRVGPFAIDQSYWQFYLGYEGANISLSYTGGNGTLHLLAEPLGCASVEAAGGVNCSDYALVVVPRYLWFRGGSVAVDASGTIQMQPIGHAAPTVVTPTQPATGGLPLPAALSATPHAAFSFAGGRAVGLREGATAPSVATVAAAVGKARAAELARYAEYGEYAEVKEALQAATLFNYIYTPAEYGPVLPVSRAWNFVKYAANLDWAYVIFDWDNIFASYMTSLDPRGKHIAYSNLIQVVRSRTAKGLVPNYAAGGTKSVDRTEPPIGAKVLSEVYGRYRDLWLVELLFDDLLAWSDWFAAERMHGPLGLVSLGSDHIDGYTDAAAGTMQGARFESGLDNSPMYDGELFAANLSSDGAFAVGQMQLYDVGFASMVAMEAEALAALAPLVGRGEAVARLEQRAATQRKLIAAHLWDEQGGIYTNRFWNGSFYRRISPTSFYAMLAKAPTDAQAAAMVSNWLLSPEHFCIAPHGDFAGNHDDCYWGLPSIQRADPAFPPLGYWRGYVWGPMAQLTYWSLQQYDHVPAVRSGRKALCKQMTALLLSQWRQHRHICENFSPHKTADDHGGDCSGTKFYHWGALTGMITLIEEGYYKAER